MQLRDKVEQRLKEAGLSNDLDIHYCNDEKLLEICSIKCYDQTLLFRRMRLKNRWSQLIHAHSAIDHIASEFLFQKLPNRDILRIERWGLQQKIDLLYAMNACDKRLHKIITFINNLRNKAAHRLNFSVDENHVREILNLYALETFDTLNKKPTFAHALVVAVALLEGQRQTDIFEALRRRGAVANAKKALEKIDKLLPKHTSEKKQKEG